MNSDEPIKEMPGQNHRGMHHENLITRRQFLQGSWLLFASGVLAACVPDRAENEIGFQTTPWKTATPARVLSSPMPAGTDASSTEAPENLAAFLALSSVLTGIEELDPQLGQVFLQHLQGHPEFGSHLSNLFEQSGIQSGNPPADIESLSATGIFGQEGSRSLADRIIEIWYSGMIEENGEQVVVTFVDALAWKAIRYTKPLTICGYFGFWAERPGEMG